MAQQINSGGFTFKRLESPQRAAATHLSPGAATSTTSFYSPSGLSPIASRGGGGGAAASAALQQFMSPEMKRAASISFTCDAAVETDDIGSGDSLSNANLSDADLQRLLAEQQQQQHQSRSRFGPDGQPLMRHPLLVKSHVEFTPVALTALLRHSALEQLDRRVQRLEHVEKVTEEMEADEMTYELLAQQRDDSEARPMARERPHHQSAYGSGGGGGGSNSPARASAFSRNNNNNSNNASGSFVNRAATPPRPVFSSDRRGRGGASSGRREYVSLRDSPSDANRVREVDTNNNSFSSSPSASFGSGRRNAGAAGGGTRAAASTSASRRRRNNNRVDAPDEDLPEAALKFHQLREEYMKIRQIYRGNQHDSQSGLRASEATRLADGDAENKNSSNNDNNNINNNDIGINATDAEKNQQQQQEPDSPASPPPATLVGVQGTDTMPPSPSPPPTAPPGATTTAAANQ